MKPSVRVIVEPAPRRKGFAWRQVGRTGATAAISPKTYDSLALAKRAGQAQVDKFNDARDAAIAQLIKNGVLPLGVYTTNPAAILEVRVK